MQVKWPDTKLQSTLGQLISQAELGDRWGTQAGHLGVNYLEAVGH